MKARLIRVGAWLLAAVAVLYLLLIGIELVRQACEWPTLHRDRDFPSYYLAAQRLLRGQDTYSGLQEDARHLGIAGYFIDSAVNPPTFTVATLFLALVPYAAAWGLWQVLSLAALVVSMALLIREAREKFSGPAWLRLVCAALLFPPLGFHLLYAHTELFLLLALTAAWVLLRRGKEIPAGILLGLAAAIRIYPLFLLLHLLQRRSWKALGAAVAGGLSWAGLTALVADPSSFWHYLATLQEEVPTLYPRWGNFSLWGSVHKLASIWPALGERPALRDGLALALSAGILLLTLWLARRPGRRPAGVDRAYGLFIVGALLASPLSWIYYQVLLYVPFFFLLVGGQRERRRPAVTALLVVALAASLAPVLGGWGTLPTGWSRLVAFLPTVTLVATYAALALGDGEPSPKGFPAAPSTAVSCDPQQTSE